MLGTALMPNHRNLIHNPMHILLSSSYAISLSLINVLYSVHAHTNWQAPSGLFGMALQKGFLFLAVEQNVMYKKPIPPLAPYVVELSCSVRDEKWIIYKHRFLKYNENSINGRDIEGNNDISENEEVEYAVVDLRAVMKEKSGKTVHPMAMREASEWSKELFDNSS